MIVKTYGPYRGADGRSRLMFKHDDGTFTCQSYPRYLMEQKLGRTLSPRETVDHIDGDVTNDNEDNLQILSVGDNIRKSHPGPSSQHGT